VRVTIWGETDRLLLRCDRFVEIHNVTQTLEVTLEGYSEITETCRLHRMILGYKSIRNSNGVDGFLEVCRHT
jgi:hypothetical protein